MADSSTGGYLLPAAAIAEDAALDAIFQKMVVGMTGLTGGMVRPRWQVVNPKPPEPTVNWVSVGVTDDNPDSNAAVTHIDGQDNLRRHEEITVSATFYGPGARSYAKMVRDGLFIAQNREELRANGIEFINTGRIIAVPELVNQQWQRRYDMPIVFRRVITRSYAVLDIETADIVLETDDITTEIHVNQ